MTNDIDTTRRTLLTAGAAGLAVAGMTGGAQAQTANRLLEGQTVFITGAARGIGRAIAIAMADAGADVAAYDILTDIPDFPIPMATPEDMAETQAGVEAAGVQFRSYAGDIRDLDAQQAAHADADAALGPIGIVVANAGVNLNAGFLIEKPDTWSTAWETVTDVNIKGTAATLRATVPAMTARGSGRVIIVGSTFGRQGNASNPAYIASKWATQGMMKALAIEVGKQGVTVNTVNPTAVQTGFGGPRTQEQIDGSNAWLAANYHQLDVGLLQPEDIAGSTVFLASPGAAMITGTSIDVSAGAAARYTA
ncbi:NADP-dependent 3-hydroxy acid dehydrogenase YdfG [Cribrihabitans marinus]|uniref:NADP-dependent 3-hydroxy acid dehydrogenase YdfG n=1 Tax=Cribrihabitans marinus TaxID=1227549 RepID=A0A1H7E5P7_9RHOB|nr:SDR family NAD(P)-dependent oxidoreductase [Cribrihabitans marinus]GGH42107.1 NAD-dependent oxidoreductase [Cribrihabitans marinus]SEK08367.1 NADP-dependent 3-hydroxy acid dehydrogenase YdfG [Cribrihabitans marinus]